MSAGRWCQTHGASTSSPGVNTALGTKASNGNHPGIALRIFHGTWNRGFRRTILKNNVGLKKFERATMTRIGRYQIKSRQLYWQCFLPARQSRPAQNSPKLKQRLYPNAA